MSMKQGDVFILEEKELALLLQARGITYFQGFPLTEIPKKREEVLEVLQGLVEKGFLDSDGISFQAEAEVAACISLLEKPLGLLLLNPAGADFPQSFCYPGKQVLVCQPSAFKAGAVKIWRMEWKELGEFVSEQGRETLWQAYEWKCTGNPRTFRLVFTREYLFELESNGEKQVFAPEVLGEFLKRFYQAETE